MRPSALPLLSNICYIHMSFVSLLRITLSENCSKQFAPLWSHERRSLLKIFTPESVHHKTWSFCHLLLRIIFSALSMLFVCTILRLVTDCFAKQTAWTLDIAKIFHRMRPHEYKSPYRKLFLSVDDRELLPRHEGPAIRTSVSLLMLYKSSCLFHLSSTRQAIFHFLLPPALHRYYCFTPISILTFMIFSTSDNDQAL